ncbi:MAG: NAD(P)-dependent oxidoreductase [Oscillospiraceae bacterium]
MSMALVGCTGFVGGNIASQHPFDALYHSTNITSAHGTKPDLLIFAGLPAAKYLANENKAADMALCKSAFDNITAIGAKRVVLISTVDVYKSPLAVDENTIPDAAEPYGANRAWLESEISKLDNSLIIRLPGLFGRGLKKNFIFDMIELIPAMLKSDKYNELSCQSALIAPAYTKSDNGFYKLNPLSKNEKAELKAFFANNDFNAMSFTDSRSEYQFYDLSCIWHDITWALAANLSVVNFSTDPVSAGEIYAQLTHGASFVNELNRPFAKYDMRSKYAALFGGENGYLYTKQDTITFLKDFINCCGGLNL